ncbi:MAG: ComEA family DNA-binding protein [Pseudomonadales bacterium]|nr:ComEA family DNA-binding protein [Pseudomonadales bacterium]
MKVIFSLFVLFIGLYSLTLPSYAADKTASKIGQKVVQIKAAPININTASAEQLADQLVGIGMSRAVDIVAYRKANGPFRHVDDLAAVKGIGERTVKRNQSKIRLK